MNSDVLLVRNLNLYVNKDGNRTQILHNINLRVPQGETVGLIGETGCGKTLTSRSIIGLLPNVFSVSGEIIVSGKNILTCSEKELAEIRRHVIATIPQNPMTSLDPLVTIREHMFEILGNNSTKREKETKCREAIASVELDPNQVLRAKPYELSGGMLQRVLIAMALIRNPRLIIADEITTALDVNTQLKILSLLKKLRNDRSISLIVITHDMKVVNALCDYVYLMYLGRIVESGPVHDILSKPKHPYTQALLRATPRVGMKEMEPIRGMVPNLDAVPSGCSFHTRCPFAFEPCFSVEPELIPLEKSYVSCHLYSDKEKRFG